MAWIEPKIHWLAAQRNTTELTSPANFLGVWSPHTYELDCSSSDVTTCSPGLEESVKLSLWQRASIIWSCKFSRHVEPKYWCTCMIAQAMTSSCVLLQWRTQLRWICDAIRHNFKWSVCDVMKRKGLKEFHYVATLNSFTKTLMYLKTSRLVLFRVKIQFQWSPVLARFSAKNVT